MTKKTWRLTGAALQAGARLLQLNADRTAELDAIRERVETELDAVNDRYQVQINALQKEIADILEVPEDQVEELAIDASYFADHGEIYLVHHQHPGKMTLQDVMSMLTSDTGAGALN